VRDGSGESFDELAAAQGEPNLRLEVELAARRD
jgi:hypothetical protein